MPPEPLPPLRPRLPSRPEEHVLPPAPIPGRPPRGYAAGALILGVIAFFNGFLPIVGIVLGLPAVVLGVVALQKKQPKHFAITGIATGAVGALSSVLATIAFAS
jgi:hypothetical protein